MTAQILEFPERTDRIEVSADALPLACGKCHHTSFTMLCEFDRAIVVCNRCGYGEEF